MGREQYNAEKEHQVIGTYPCIRGMEVVGMSFIPETPRFYRPIPTKENYKMVFEGKKPYWIPVSGWVFCDVTMFRPRQHPDNLANHQCIDGGDFVDWKKLGNVVKGWFDLPLEWEPLSMGATVRPGNPMMPDLNGWQEVLKFPNLDEINFDEIGELNKDYLSTDRLNQLGIQFGFWERMMNIMGVDNAAVSLLDEDQEEAVHSFLDALADLYIDYIDRISKVCPIDSVYLHDDWGTNNGPFFSLETAREFFVPPMKKVVDFCHSKGYLFEHHSCGNAGKLVPAMEECGTDYWLPQFKCNDIDQLIEEYKDYNIKFGVYNPVLPIGSTQDEIRELAHKWVEKYKDANILMCMNTEIGPADNHDGSLFSVFSDAVYEYSRIAYQDVED